MSALGDRLRALAVELDALADERDRLLRDVPRWRGQPVVPYQGCDVMEPATAFEVDKPDRRLDDRRIDDRSGEWIAALTRAREARRQQMAERTRDEVQMPEGLW